MDKRVKSVRDNAECIISELGILVAKSDEEIVDFIENDFYMSRETITEDNGYLVCDEWLAG